MKQLFPKQRESADYLLSTLRKHRGALDSSSTGVGKTVIACRVAAEMGVPTAVVCPKIVVPHWERELAEAGVEPLFVSNYEKIRGRGLKPHLNKRGRKTFEWTLPKDSLIIFDECHKMRGPFTQNTQLLVAAVQQRYHTLLLSATSCEDPTDMRGIGYALGLHSLNKGEHPLKSWPSWMLSLGCRKDPWGNWVPCGRNKLRELGEWIYTHRACKLTPADLPAAFSDNHIITEPLAFSGLSSIRKFYDEFGVTPEIVDQILAGEGVSAHAMTEILRARQLAEAAKVPDIIEMTHGARLEGLSVVVFVNFRDTMDALRHAFQRDAVYIYGGQSAKEREDSVQKFQSNEIRVVICNISAGGVGVSLHDVHGGHPRISFVNPTFSVTDYVQCLGRIHRAGAKSPAVQKVLVAAGTIEEHVVRRLTEKRMMMDALHQNAEARHGAKDADLD
jgi:superfamily II DNA or RNA helicase